MKKKHFAAIAAAITLAVTSSATLYSVSAAEQAKISGDINTDGGFSIADIAMAQKYLLRGAEIKEAGFRNADMNSDGSVDVFDMCLMRSQIQQSCAKITQTVGYLSGQNGFWKKSYENPDAVITSAEELEQYFMPSSVITTEGDCYIIEVATQEEIDSLLEIYNDEFFENNVLCLRAITQPSGGIEYEIENIFYEGNTLNIQYHEVYTSDSTTDIVIARLAQVVVPKELYMADSVVWEETEAEWLFEPEIRTDITNAANFPAWSIAMSDSPPQIITSAEELNTWLDGKFKSAVERSFINTYTDEYFNENVLILDLYPQRWRDTWNTTVSAERTGYDTIELCYDREFINGFVDEGIMITQVSVPIEQYYGDTVISSRTWEAPVDNISCYEFDMGQYEEAVQTQFTLSYGKDGAWINSDEELDEYLSDCFTAEGIELLKYNFFNEDLNEYSAYVWVDSDIIGSSHHFMSAYNGEDGISAVFNNYQPLSCYGGAFVHVIYADKEYSGEIVSLRTFNSNSDNLKCDGELTRFSLGEPFWYTLLVNQYTFGDESSADIYLAYPGGGPSEFGDIELIGSLELEKNYFPFSGDYISTFDESGNITYTGSDFSITENENSVIIQYRPSDGAEMTETEIKF
ncbi:MAG: dockerin type I repeat-containing protein [Ruminococcus sp.]|nr:dockerin type I repeat-containing protein [Ruminococcus sp.]